MFEVEAKVAISKGEFENLKKELSHEAEVLDESLKEDTYYGHPRNAYIRIRRRGGESTFDIKRRQTTKGIESNIEMEWRIRDLPKWKNLLRKLVIKPSVRKTKKSLRFKKKDFIIELNHVRLLGYYLEIERIVENESELKRVKRGLTALFREMGYSEKQFEPRPYLELLADV